MRILFTIALLLFSHSPLAELDERIKVVIEEPVEGGRYAAISNLRGWAISPEGMGRYLLEVYIDKEFAFGMAPYGQRTDVGSAFPDYPSADTGGFSMAFNYKNLTPGEHEIIVRAYDNADNYNEAKATFRAERFDSEFIANDSEIDLSTTENIYLFDKQSYLVSGATLEGEKWDFLLKWDRASQSFKTEGIVPTGSGSGEAYACITSPSENFSSSAAVVVMKNGAELNNYEGKSWFAGDRHVMFKTVRENWYTDENDRDTYRIDLTKEPETCFVPDLFEVTKRTQYTGMEDSIEWEGGSGRIDSTCGFQTGAMLYLAERPVPTGWAPTALNVLTAEKCDLN